MHIGYDLKNGVEYAKLCCSHWVDGKDKKTYVNLGRVIDKENHIFKNRERGLFRYDLRSNEYFPIDPDEYSLDAGKKKMRIFSFGDVWFLDQYLRKTGLDRVLRSIHCDAPDTVFALVQFYILNRLGLSHFRDWYTHSYASILYPRATCSSQRLSEQLAWIGSEDSYHDFFAAYIAFMERSGEDLNNILIDSTGLPNSIHFPLTGVCTHNGKTSNEVRMIYVTQEKTGIPVYLRYVQGSIPDVSTVIATLKELEEVDIHVQEALIDAGYYSEKNIQALYHSNVGFVCRMKENLRLYKELASKYKDTLEREENMVKFGKRIVFIKKVKVDLAPNCPGFAYVCLDLSRKDMEIERVLDHLDPKETASSELFETIESKGMFVLASSTDLEINEILPVYYTRQEIEQTFDITKNYTNLLPLRIRSEANLRGHLLLTFMAASIVKRIQNELLEAEMKRSKRIRPTGLFQNLSYQHCSVYKDKTIIEEADAIPNKGYEIFEIQCPEEIQNPTG